MFGAIVSTVFVGVFIRCTRSFAAGIGTTAFTTATVPCLATLTLGTSIRPSAFGAFVTHFKQKGGGESRPPITKIFKERGKAA